MLFKLPLALSLEETKGETVYGHLIQSPFLPRHSFVTVELIEILLLQASNRR